MVYIYIHISKPSVHKHMYTYIRVRVNMFPDPDNIQLFLSYFVCRRITMFMVYNLIFTQRMYSNGLLTEGINR